MLPAVLSEVNNALVTRHDKRRKTILRITYKLVRA